MADRQPTSPFQIITSLHEYDQLRRSEVGLRTTSSSPRKNPLNRSMPLPKGMVDTAPKSLSSFLRHKMRKLTKVEPAYVRKLMSSNLIKAHPVPQLTLATESGRVNEDLSPTRPQTCTASARLTRSLFHSSSPTKPLTLTTRPISTPRQPTLDSDFQHILTDFDRTKTHISTNLQSMERARSMEKTMMKFFFGTVKLISDIDCRKMRHLPTIFYTKVESQASYLEDAKNISTEYRKGISDPSRFVGKIERKRWGRQKIRPEIRFNLPK